MVNDEPKPQGQEASVVDFPPEPQPEPEEQPHESAAKTSEEAIVSLQIADVLQARGGDTSYGGGSIVRIAYDESVLQILENQTRQQPLNKRGIDDTLMMDAS